MLNDKTRLSSPLWVSLYNNASLPPYLCWILSHLSLQNHPPPFSPSSASLEAVAVGSLAIWVQWIQPLGDANRSEERGHGIYSLVDLGLIVVMFFYGRPWLLSATLSSSNHPSRCPRHFSLFLSHLLRDGNILLLTLSLQAVHRRLT